jgi:Outer membrane protein beta-barrel domain
MFIRLSINKLTTMKKTITVFAFVLLTTLLYSQENRITLSGGYVFANVEDTDVNGTGFRINGLYEYNPEGGKWAHGFSVGYVGLSAEGTEGLQTVQYDIGSWPLYYAPKYLFGSENFKGFIKGAIGMQFSSFERTAALTTISDSDLGFTGGGGVGAHYFFNDKIFLTAEYELLWMSNSYYKDGLLNTASAGIGIRF